MTARWTNVKGIAYHLCLSKETIYRMVARGDIPFHRVGKLLLFDINEVDKSIKGEK